MISAWHQCDDGSWLNAPWLKSWFQTQVYKKIDFRHHGYLVSVVVQCRRHVGHDMIIFLFVLMTPQQCGHLLIFGVSVVVQCLRHRICDDNVVVVCACESTKIHVV